MRTLIPAFLILSIAFVGCQVKSDTATDKTITRLGIMDDDCKSTGGTHNVVYKLPPPDYQKKKTAVLAVLKKKVLETKELEPMKQRTKIRRQAVKLV